MACVEQVKALQAEGFECIEPVFLVYQVPSICHHPLRLCIPVLWVACCQGGQRVKTIKGINGPDVEAALREAKESM